MPQSKALIILIFLLIISGCASQKNPLSKPFYKKIEATKNTSITYVLTPNSKLETFKDTQKNTFIKIGRGNSIVIKIEAIKKSNKNIADSGYREVLYFEIPNIKQDIKMGDLKKDDMKLWFARFCFCRDYIGFYKITDGQLEIKLSKSDLKIKATIKFNNLPQVLSFIDQKILINQ